MKEEQLIKIRNKYEKLQTIKNNIDKLTIEKKKLEGTKQVQRYNEILTELKNEEKSSGIINQTDEQLIALAVNTVLPSDTNNIYVFMGKYRYKKDEHFIFLSRNHRVKNDDSSATSVVYKNLEDECEIHVPIAQDEKFKSSNNIIYIETDNYNKLYEQLRYIYFKEAIQSDETKAIKKVLDRQYR